MQDISINIQSVTYRGAYVKRNRNSEYSVSEYVASCATSVFSSIDNSGIAVEYDDIGTCGKEKDRLSDGT